MNPLDWYRRARDWLLLRRAVRNGLTIGRDVRIIGAPHFGSEPYLVRIGNHVTVSAGVAFYTHDGGTWIFRDRPEYAGLQRFGRIDVEDNCFIGARSILLPGVRVGPNAVVAAGSVVTKSVPPDTVVGGVPARRICSAADYVRRSSARCTYYPPEVTADPARLRRALQAQFPPPNRGRQSAPPLGGGEDA